MDNCRHISKLTPSVDHSVLNPQNWACMVCGTTESVWACLSCSNVACGRYIAEHALKHYEESGHSLAMEVNDRYVFWYVELSTSKTSIDRMSYQCGDYVLNDNAHGDIQVLRSCLHTIATRGRLSSLEVADRHQRLLRSCSAVALGKGFEDLNLEDEDRKFTALWFRRRGTLAKVFHAWQRCSKLSQTNRMQTEDGNKKDGMAREDHPIVDETPQPRAMTLRPLLGRVLVPGMTGLRNLGNTCYINSVLQMISHLQEFREYFIQRSRIGRSYGSSANSARRSYLRQTTMECFEYVNSGAPSQESRTGLNGGSATTRPAINANVRVNMNVGNDTNSLTDELSALFRVMWSGKWAVVSPHRFLSAVWTRMPFFRGYSQQDAQEFLSELMDKVQAEVTSNSEEYSTSSRDSQSTSKANDIVSRLCHGELVSQVTCLACARCSQRFEPFTDLSLDFPARYHAVDGSSQSPSVESIHVNELLSEFTHIEKLDGPVYACDSCNAGKDGSRIVRTEAEKRILLSRLPNVLRLHLKRFMWGGRNSRGKIAAHVIFDDILRLEPFCTKSSPSTDGCQGGSAAGLPVQTEYRLASVIVHHGRGFGSGHYTAYCRNVSAGLWVHCNDSVVSACSLDDVHKSQAYIVVYVRVSSKIVRKRQPSECKSAKHVRVDPSVAYDLRSRSISSDDVIQSS